MMLCFAFSPLMDESHVLREPLCVREGGDPQVLGAPRAGSSASLEEKSKSLLPQPTVKKRANSQEAILLRLFCAKKGSFIKA